MTVKLATDVTEEQQREYYVGLLYHFMHGGSYDEEEISEFKPANEYKHACKAFKVLLKNGYMYPSRSSSDRVEIIDSNS